VLVAGDGIRDRGAEREGVPEPGEPEDLQDRAAGDEFERAVLLAQPPEAADQGTQAGGVQEVHLAQVRDDVPDAAGEQADDPLAELRGGVHVDLARDPQDGAVGAGGDGFQVKGRHADLHWCHRES